MSSTNSEMDQMRDKEDAASTTSPPHEPQSTPPPLQPRSPAPNGGSIAWLQVLGSFMLYFNTWGILNAFGVYQTYYESGALFRESSSNISWIGSITAFMLLFTGLFAGPIFDRGYFRTLLFVGGFLVVFGNMMLSICTTYWEVLLAQGFCIGIGTGLLFVPCVAILPQYFSSRLGLAVGVAATGSSLGGVIYPIVLYRLLDKIGFGWSVRVIGFIALGTLIIPLSLMKLRVKPGRVRAILDWSAFTDVTYMSFVFSVFLSFWALFVVLFYLSYYAEDQHITGVGLSFYLVAIFNAASCFGRSLPNAISDYTGPFNIIAPGALIIGALIFCMIAVTSEAAIIVVAILQGFASGILVALPPICLFKLTDDKSKIGTRLGMGFAMIGAAAFVGGPGSGAVLGQSNPLHWHALWIYGGVAACASSIGLFFVRGYKYGWVLRMKA